MVYLWVDGVYVKAGLEREGAALLVAVEGLVDGRKEVVAVVPSNRSGMTSWRAGFGRARHGTPARHDVDCAEV